MVALHQFSDNELVRNYQNNQCEQSIKILIERYSDKLFTSIYYIVKDRYIAEDLLQETLIKATNNILKGKYTEQGKFAPWASRIAHNLCIDYIRKTKAGNTIKVIKSENLDIARLSIQEKTAYHSIVEEEDNCQLWKLIQELPQEQMEVLVMRVYGEMSFKEISEAMKVSINTSLGRMRYGLQNLRKKIEENNLVLR